MVPELQEAIMGLPLQANIAHMCGLQSGYNTS